MKKADHLDLEAVDRWYAANFERLVQEYGGKVIAVIGEEIVAVTEDEAEADHKAREAYPGSTPTVLAIPTEKELACLL